MAKYVCDTDTVKSIGEKLCQTASDISNGVQSYSSSIESDLSTWTGTAKESFNSSNATYVTTAKTDATYINALGEFVKNAAESIQSLEDELAGLLI